MIFDGGPRKRKNFVESFDAEEWVNALHSVMEGRKTYYTSRAPHAFVLRWSARYRLMVSSVPPTSCRDHTAPDMGFNQAYGCLSCRFTRTGRDARFPCPFFAYRLYLFFGRRVLLQHLVSVRDAPNSIGAAKGHPFGESSYDRASVVRFSTAAEAKRAEQTSCNTPPEGNTSAEKNRPAPARHSSRSAQSTLDISYTSRRTRTQTR